MVLEPGAVGPGIRPLAPDIWSLQSVWDPVPRCLICP